MRQRLEVNQQRLARVLQFLAVSAGAALVSKGSRAVVGAAGDVDDAAAVAALDVELDDAGGIRHVEPDALITDVGLRHRLFVRLPPQMLPDTQTLQRMRRARDILEKFVFRLTAPAGSAPAGNAPAHAVVFASRRRPSR